MAAVVKGVVLERPPVWGVEGCQAKQTAVDWCCRIESSQGNDDADADELGPDSS